MALVTIPPLTHFSQRPIHLAKMGWGGASDSSQLPASRNKKKRKRKRKGKGKGKRKRKRKSKRKRKEEIACMKHV